MKLVRITLAILASFMLIGLLSPAVQADDKDKAKVKLKVEIVSPLSVITRNATGIGIRRATLNGSLTSLGRASPADVYFEWGPTTKYKFTTEPQTMTKPRTFRATITGLTPGETYFFRAKAVGDDTTVSGDESSFTIKRRGWWGRTFDEIFSRLIRLFQLRW